jgi:hypothetical protein
MLKSFKGSAYLSYRTDLSVIYCVQYTIFSRLSLCVAYKFLEYLLSNSDQYSYWKTVCAVPPFDNHLEILVHFLNPNSDLRNTEHSEGKSYWRLWSWNEITNSTVSICMPLFPSVLNTCYFVVFLVAQYNKNCEVSVCLVQNMHIFFVIL